MNVFLIEQHYHDPEFIETLNAHEMTYQDLMEKIETSYESSNQNKDSYTKELIYGEATVLNLDILNSVIYKHAETKKVILTENLKPLEKTIQYVLKQIKNIFNAKNELIDKELEGFQRLFSQYLAADVAAPIHWEKIEKLPQGSVSTHCSKYSFFVQNSTLISRENCRFFW